MQMGYNSGESSLARAQCTENMCEYIHTRMGYIWVAIYERESVPDRKGASFNNGINGHER